MFIEILLFLVVGTLAGFVMGLIPGIHPNMIVLLVPFLAGASKDIEGVYSITAFVVGMGVANSFSSFIPSIYLGASDDASLLAVHPGHRMLLAGMGHEAVMHTVFGGIISVAITIAILPLMAIAVPVLYAATRNYIWILLLIISAYMIFSERGALKKTAAFTVFGISGFFGLAALNSPLESAYTLFPVLAGLFGAPVLFEQVISKTKVPEQNAEEGIKKGMMPPLLGTLGGIAAGFLPGVGSTVIASIATQEKNAKAFLATIGAITTANILVSFLAMWLIGNPRSGVAVAISQITAADFSLFLLMVFAVMVSAALAAVLTSKASAVFSRKIHKINYTKISVAVLAFVFAAAFWFSGFLGIWLLVTSSALGIFTARCRIRRGILMGVLIVPTIMFLAF